VRQDPARRLRIALGELRAFLRRANMPHYDAGLDTIDRKIVDPATRREGLRELEESFAGMGSLNDIFICRENGNVPPGQSPEAANMEVNRLLDVVFRELRLVDAPAFTRLLWRGCEWWYRGEPAPRITRAFGAPRR
jgi:hypothetical protein